MGHGAGSNYADVISWKDLKKLCPKETRAIPNLGFLCRFISDGFDIRFVDAKILKNSWENLKAAFAKATKVGKSRLTLSAGYHDQESEGDRYDEVSGGYFAVHGLYQETPAGKKIGKKVTRKFFVTYG